jgi:pimeloyl-ACP methyl ester carboxylesterase
VIAPPDCAGIGQTSRRTVPEFATDPTRIPTLLSSWRAPQFADALAAFVAALGLGRPHVVGHSFETMVALSLLRYHPAVPASQVLVGGYAGWAGSLPRDEVARRLQMFLGMAELGDAFDPKSYSGLFSELIPADRDGALATMMRDNVRPAVIRAAGHIGAETDFRPVLPTVDVPTLVLHGEADARSPVADARRSTPRYPHRDSSCSRSSATRAWWRTVRLVRRSSAVRTINGLSLSS